MDSWDPDSATSSRTTTCTAPQHEKLHSILSDALVLSHLNPDTISHFLAVLYMLFIAAPTAVASALAIHTAAVNHFVTVVSVIVNKQDSTNAADSAPWRWQQWQQLASAIGLTPCYLPILLSPASKAILIQLEAAAAAQHVPTVRVQVYHPKNIVQQQRVSDRVPAIAMLS